MNSANVSLELRYVAKFLQSPKSWRLLAIYYFFTLLIEIPDKYYIVFLCAEIKMYYTNSPNESLEN